MIVVQLCSGGSRLTEGTTDENLNREAAGPDWPGDPCGCRAVQDAQLEQGGLGGFRRGHRAPTFWRIHPDGAEAWHGKHPVISKPMRALTTQA